MSLGSVKPMIGGPVPAVALVPEPPVRPVALAPPNPLDAPEPELPLPKALGPPKPELPLSAPEVELELPKLLLPELPNPLEPPNPPELPKALPEPLPKPLPDELPVLPVPLSGAYRLGVPAPRAEPLLPVESPLVLELLSDEPNDELPKPLPEDPELEPKPLPDDPKPLPDDPKLDPPDDPKLEDPKPDEVLAPIGVAPAILLLLLPKVESG